jgi:hypothetical protein
VTREEAIAYFEQHVEIMDQPPIHLGSAVAVEEWAKRTERMKGAYRLAIAALREQDATDTNVGHKWISVEERLPVIEDSEPFDEFTEDRGYIFLVADEGGYVFTATFWIKANRFGDPSITHWMPLPEPPTKEEV